ncbi:MAG: bifunctional diguanylate cyclase/phosphodiesterase [Aquihabitans sp.]
MQAAAIAGGALVFGAMIQLELVSSFGAWSGRTLGVGLDVIATVSIVIAAASVVAAVRRRQVIASVQEEMQRLEDHDPLTGLPNRRLLGPWVAADIASSALRSGQAALVFIDLDRFKHVNDAFGHEIGDELMRAVADRLKSVLGPGDRVLRFGGDEFVLLCPNLTGAIALEKLANRLVRLVEQPFIVASQTIRISASVGAALAEHRNVLAEDLLRDADVARYQAKANGPGQVVVFERSMAGALTPANAEHQINQALRNGEFQLHYQPVVDLSTGRILAAEALIRWISPERGTLAPDQFVPILEETGLIVPVGTWVLEEACREAARLRELMPDRPPIAITINVSARQLSQTGFAELVAAALHQTGAAEGQIHLEITEGALMHDVATAWVILRQCKALGVKLALDDFGTGYSSLSYVRRFSLDMLKIDKSFIDGIDTSPEDRAIVEHVIGLADALGMTTVAEGVERPEQLAWLRHLGCRLAQGFALSRPLTAPDMEALLLRRDNDPYHIPVDPSDPVELSTPDVASLTASGIFDTGPRVPWVQVADSPSRPPAEHREPSPAPPQSIPDQLRPVAPPIVFAAPQGPAGDMSRSDLERPELDDVVVDDVDAQIKGGESESTIDLSHGSEADPGLAGTGSRPGRDVARRPHALPRFREYRPTSGPGGTR